MHCPVKEQNVLEGQCKHPRKQIKNRMSGMEWLCDPLNMDDKNACGYDYFIMKPFNIYLYEASEL